MIQTNGLIAYHSIIAWDPRGSLRRESPFRIMTNVAFGRDEITPNGPVTKTIEVDISGQSH
jgi:hypothetical protein